MVTKILNEKHCSLEQKYRVEETRKLERDTPSAWAFLQILRGHLIRRTKFHILLRPAAVDLLREAYFKILIQSSTRVSIEKFLNSSGHS